MFLQKRLATPRIPFFLLMAMIGSVTSFSTTPPPASVPRQETKVFAATLSRQDLIHTIITGTPVATAVLLFSWPANAMPPQKSYSTNAKNLDRLNAGDSSGGSVYNNNPTAPAARRRRAMQGCKVGSARKEAGRILGQPKKKQWSEKECVSDNNCIYALIRLSLSRWWWWLYKYRTVQSLRSKQMVSSNNIRLLRFIKTEYRSDAKQS